MQQNYTLHFIYMEREIKITRQELRSISNTIGSYSRISRDPNISFLSHTRKIGTLLRDVGLSCLEIAPRGTLQDKYNPEDSLLERGNKQPNTTAKIDGGDEEVYKHRSNSR